MRPFYYFSSHAWSSHKACKLIFLSRFSEIPWIEQVSCIFHCIKQSPTPDRIFFLNVLKHHFSFGGLKNSGAIIKGPLGRFDQMYHFHYTCFWLSNKDGTLHNRFLFWWTNNNKKIDFLDHFPFSIMCLNTEASSGSGGKPLACPDDCKVVGSNPALSQPPPVCCCDVATRGSHTWEKCSVGLHDAALHPLHSLVPPLCSPSLLSRDHGEVHPGQVASSSQHLLKSSYLEIWGLNFDIQLSWPFLLLLIITSVLCQRHFHSNIVSFALILHRAVKSLFVSRSSRSSPLPPTGNATR